MFLGATCGECNTIASTQPCQNLDGAEICSAIAQRQASSASLDCLVQEVVVERCRDRAPTLGWLTGHARLLYVEVAIAGVKRSARRTQTGICFQERPLGDGNVEEVWIFGSAAMLANTGIGSHTMCSYSPQSPEQGDLLSFGIPRGQVSVGLTLKIFASHATWHLALGLRAPLEPVAEAQFNLNLRGTAKERTGGERSVFLVCKGRTCGHVSLVIQQHGPNSVEEPGSDAIGDEFEFVFKANHPEWSDTIFLKANGRFERLSGDVGSWSAHGNVLSLAWDAWEPEFLCTEDCGRTFRSSLGFTLSGSVPPSWFLYFFQVPALTPEEES